MFREKQFSKEKIYNNNFFLKDQCLTTKMSFLFERYIRGIIRVVVNSTFVL